MPCFCESQMMLIPRNYARANFTFTPPKIPIQLQIAAKLPAPEAERMDVQLSAAIANMRLPTVRPAAGPLIGLAAQLNIVATNFTIDDLPQLELEMQQMAYSLHRFLLPQLNFLLQVPLMPILQLALAARLKLAIPAVKFDEAMAGAGQGVHGLRTKLALSPPQIQMLKLVAGLPGLMGMMENLNVPLADGREAGAGLAKLRGLASLKPPSIPISLPAMLALALKVDALAKIEAAFGPEGMSSAGLRRAKATLDAFLRLPLPSPLPDPALMAALDDLPQLDAVTLGTRTPPNALGMSFAPPRIQVMPFLMAAIGLRTSLNELLGIDPWNACGSACEAPLDMFAA